jgi:hypothetical protein
MNDSRPPSESFPHPTGSGGNLPGSDDGFPSSDRERLKGLFVRVMLVQVISLAFLWFLQARFGGG